MNFSQEWIEMKIFQSIHDLGSVLLDEKTCFKYLIDKGIFEKESLCSFAEK